MNNWNQRSPKLQEIRRYENIIHHHTLTQAWLVALDPETKNEPFRLKRFVPPELSQSLWLLEKIRLDRLAPQLESLINETTVSEFLDELEETVWIVQMALLENIFQSSAVENRNALFNQLEQVTWHHGKSISENQWPDFESRIGNSSKNSLPEKVYLALKKSPFSRNSNGFMLERLTPDEVSFYWIASPLSRFSLKHSSELLTLCYLHHHGMKGYLYGLIKTLKVEVSPATLKESKVWCFRISNFFDAPINRSFI